MMNGVLGDSSRRWGLHVWVLRGRAKHSSLCTLSRRHADANLEREGRVQESGVMPMDARRGAHVEVRWRLY